jgi:hypothetical protein
MNADDPDPVQRWRSIADWYAEFAAMRNWEFLAPMVALTAWVAEQPFAAPLFPGTSHEWLCVHPRPGYNPDLPSRAERGRTGNSSASCGRRSAAGEVVGWPRSSRPARCSLSSLACCTA